MSGKCKIYWGLWPFSVLYGVGVKVRNLLFDVGWLHEEHFPLPVICIGNLTVGGTGKTPHTEYLPHPAVAELVPAGRTKPGLQAEI